MPVLGGYPVRLHEPGVCFSTHIGLGVARVLEEENVLQEPDDDAEVAMWSWRSCALPWRRTLRWGAPLLDF